LRSLSPPARGGAAQACHYRRKTPTNDLFLFGGVLRVHRAVDTMTQMFAQKVAFDPRERGARRQALPPAPNLAIGC
jgi:hypothetical protein